MKCHILFPGKNISLSAEFAQKVVKINYFVLLVDLMMPRNEH